MAAAGEGIRIRLEPEDEYTHPIEAAENFNESMYFNLFDPERKLGGWFRLANRPNEGKGEMSICLYLPDGRIAFMFKRPECTNNDAFDNGGMQCRLAGGEIGYAKRSNDPFFFQNSNRFGDGLRPHQWAGAVQ